MREREKQRDTPVHIDVTARGQTAFAEATRAEKVGGFNKVTRGAPPRGSGRQHGQEIRRRLAFWAHHSVIGMFLCSF